MKELLADADKHGRAVGGFNVANMESVMGRNQGGGRDGYTDYPADCREEDGVFPGGIYRAYDG